MWKYIITWCIIIETMSPIPDFLDEFGRISKTTAYQIERKYDCDHEKISYNREEAFKFYNKACSLLQDTIWWRDKVSSMEAKYNFFIQESNQNLKDVKIDSVWIRKKDLEQELTKDLFKILNKAR